ncbi:MAG: TatD family hydrolase [Candidatus Omnitrophota bacterium]
MFIDTHCHLDFPDFNFDRDCVIKRAKDAGVDYIINVGATIESSKNSCLLSENYDFIYASVGIHPHDSDNVSSFDLATLKELAKNNKVKAIGEIGLDYYRNLSKPDNQKKIFCDSILIAKELNLPIIVHSRSSASPRGEQAADDILNIVKKYLPIPAVIHCFSDDENYLKEYLNLGFFISFTANITYKNAFQLRRLVKIVPLDKIFIETDAPYLTPQIYRGKAKNEPTYVRFVAEEIAKIKNEPLEKIAMITSANAKEFFKL